MARGDSFSKVKFEERILQELNSILRKEISDPRIQFVSLTQVQLNNDFSLAVVSWDTFDSKTRGDCKKALEGMGPKLRTLLAQNLKLRHTPKLNFTYDSRYEDTIKIEKILASVNKKNDE